MQRHISRCNHVDYLYGKPIVFLNSGTGGGMISQKKVRGIRFWVREYPDSLKKGFSSSFILFQLLSTPEFSDYSSAQSQHSASLIVASLSISSLSSAATMLSGTLLPIKSFSRALDISIMPFNERLRDSCTYKL
jgi:hypothetical protein